MPTPSGSRADAAYERARAAYEQRSYDVARRWALEALAQDPQHSGARTLLARLDAAPRPATPFQPGPSGPEVVSTDPTVLINRAAQSRAEPIEPTVMIRRDDPWKGLADTDTSGQAAASLPRYGSARGAAEPTVISAPGQRAASPRPRSSSAGSLLQWFGGIFRGSSNRTSSSATRPYGSRPRTGDGSWSPTARGAAIAITVVVVAGLFVWALIQASRWMWPAGQLLTLDKPVGGTIVGPGLRCGTGGTDCQTRFQAGEPVELQARPDEGYVFGGFTGDCGETGRVSMSQARACGVTFSAVSAAPPPVTFRLSITKPMGGTVIESSGILCGSLDSRCELDVPSGARVVLRYEADNNYTFSQFTGDCPPGGELTMDGAKNCSALFTPTSRPIANVPPPTGQEGRPRPQRQTRESTPAPPRPAPPDQPQAAPPAAAPPTVAPGTQATPTNPDKPAEPPITAEAHAKKEIQLLVKNYCAEYETLKPERVQKLFPLVNMSVLRDQFRWYKSLKCSVTSELEYERLDASPAGGAQVKFGMKQEIEKKSGKEDEIVETIVTMVVSRTDLRSPWFIDRVRHDKKPKT